MKIQFNFNTLINILLKLIIEAYHSLTITFFAKKNKIYNLFFMDFFRWLRKRCEPWRLRRNCAVHFDFVKMFRHHGLHFVLQNVRSHNLPKEAWPTAIVASLP